jgi:hypothetical protein
MDGHRTLWKELERNPRAKHLNLHQAMRAALLGWLTPLLSQPAAR